MLGKFQSMGLAALCILLFLQQAKAEESSEERWCINPNAPEFSHLSCASDMDDYDRYICKVTCNEGYEFPDGTTEEVHECNEADGKWTPKYDFRNCKKACSPPCENNATCASGNICICQQGFRGHRCSHALSLCNPKEKYHATGEWKCEHTNSESTCNLICPQGTKYEYPPEKHYTCSVDGTWDADAAPTCVPNNVAVSAKKVFLEDDEVPDSFFEERVCAIWSHVHYRTFDSAMYNFEGYCSYLLTKDCADNTFAIYIQRHKGTDQSLLTIIVQDDTYALHAHNGTGVVKHNDHKHPVPYTHGGLIFEMLGNLYIVNTPFGIRIKWDKAASILIRADAKLSHKLCGLCGKYDGENDDDLEMADGKQTKSIEQFVDSWSVDDGNEKCESAKTYDPCGSENNVKALWANKTCSAIYDPKFADCHKLVDPAFYFETCKMDYCSCKSVEADSHHIDHIPHECVCEAITHYFTECRRLGVQIPGGWRSESLCPLHCHEGMVFDDCGSICPKTCSGKVYNCDEGQCMDGCHCPPGKVMHDSKCIDQSSCPCVHKGKEIREGDKVDMECNTCMCVKGDFECTDNVCASRCTAIGHSHFTTFDGNDYEFSGVCPMYLIHNEDFTIVMEPVPCPSGSVEGNSDHCAKEVTMNYKGTTFTMKPGMDPLVEGKLTELPLLVNDVAIYRASSMFRKVDFPNGMSLMWDERNRLYLDAPPSLVDQTKGLCGTFNNRQTDDFVTPNGDHEPDVSVFATSWQLSTTCNKPTQSDRTSCDLQPENLVLAKSVCKVLMNESLSFASCNHEVDPEEYYKRCIHEVCSCPEVSMECACPIFGDYSCVCSKKGISLKWTEDVPSCRPKCPAGQVYQECGDPCVSSCMTISMGKICKSNTCVQGCGCPKGMTLNSEDMCITVAQCPCYREGKAYSASSSHVFGEEVCECENAKWSCRPQPTTAELPVEPADSECATKRNMKYTSCLEDCPVTCQNLKLPAKCTTKVCKSGCRCNKGFVLDKDADECVPESECKCYHGGHGYEKGSTIRKECNLCTCDAGSWKCTERICPRSCMVWGDSHFKTYDGLMYDFYGVCEYYLSSGRLSPETYFTIITKNVMCGSKGTTCSKLFSIEVNGVEKLVLARDKPLPKPKPNGAFMVMESGASVMVFTKIGVTMQWDRGTRIYLMLEPKWRGKVKGLCGNFNDDQGDDFQTPSGGPPEARANVFGDNWKTRDSCPKSILIVDTCALNPQRDSWAHRKCDVLKSKLFAPCHSTVSLEPYYERCVFDTCACDEGGDCECLCTAIATYAQECNMLGVHIKWRSQNLCPIQCETPAQATDPFAECMTYNSCMSACPKKTCENQYMVSSIEKVCSKKPCVEGCDPKPCPPGQIYNNSIDFKCIPVDECKVSCLEVNGKMYNEGERVTDPQVADACQSCHCLRGAINCTGTPCASTTPGPTTTIPPPECTGGWSSWISHKPTAEGDEELIVDHQQQLCSEGMITDIECRVVGTDSEYEGTGENLVCAVPFGFICKHTDQPSGLCEDYEIRVFCLCPTSSKYTGPPTTPVYPCDISGWTNYFNIDNPKNNSDGNDNEHIDIIRDKHLFCADDMITDVECTTLVDGKPEDYRKVGQGKGVTCSRYRGAYCNSAKLNEDCRDYSVRFYCSCPTTPAPTTTPRTGPPTRRPKSTASPPVCEPGWTRFFNVDNPSKNPDGDDNEEMKNIRRHFEFCDTDMITDVECATEVGGEDLDYRAVGQASGVSCSRRNGLHCYKNSVSDGCRDYKIRFFCSCATRPTTPFTGTTPEPTGTPTPLPPLCTHGWTPYLNRDRPPTNPKGNDNEEIINLREVYEFCEDRMITDIQCVANINNEKIDFSLAGQEEAVKCSKYSGLQCYKMALDEGEECHDYSVRFYCDCGGPPTTVGPCKADWTSFFNIDHPKRNPREHDDERIYNLRKEREFCSDDMISDVNCITIVDNRHVDYREAGQIDAVSCNTHEGLFCNRSLLQEDCRDYFVQFFCQCPLPTPPPVILPTTKVIPSGPTEPSTSTTPEFIRSTTPSPQCTHGWTEFFNVAKPEDHPNRDDVETIENLRKVHEFCSEEMITDVECNANVNGRLVNYKATKQSKAVNCSPQRGLHCYRRALTEECYDYSIRFYCNCPATTQTVYTGSPTPSTIGTGTPSTPATCEDGWTIYFNTHNPRENPDHNDIEPIDKIRELHSFCSDEMITRVECSTPINGKFVDYRKTGQVHAVDCSLRRGLSCYSNSLDGEGCYDYYIRFYCQCASTLPDRFTTEGTGPTTTEGPCKPGWTYEFNVQLPNDTNKNDNETIREIRRYRDFCSDDMIEDIMCITRMQGQVVDYRAAGQIDAISCSKYTGLYCDSSKLQNGDKCRDYSVKFYCRCPSTTEPPFIIPTTRIGPTETETPTIYTGKPIVTLPQCTPGWTNNLNVSSPRDHPTGDDAEDIAKLRRVYEFCAEEMITDVECLASVNGRLVHYKSTKQARAVSCSTKKGLHCYRNSLNEDCHDYVVRFYCSCRTTIPTAVTGTPVIPTGPSTTRGRCVEGWTRYFNFENPKNNTPPDDNEIPTVIREKYEFCPDDMVRRVECVTVMNGIFVDYRKTNQEKAVECSPHRGLRCFSNSLDNEECHDYLIRFYCECPTTTGFDGTTPAWTATTTAGPCYPGWTGKYNFRHPRDNVGKNDYENITTIREHRDLCGDDMITDVRCTTVIGGRTVDYRDAGQANAVKCNKITGLVCDSSKLDYGNCYDYSIQFYCQCPTTTRPPITRPPPRTPSTRYTGTPTTMGPSTSTGIPTGRPTTTLPPCYPGWTDFMNVSNPKDNPKHDDVEEIPKLREQYDFCSEEMITDIECYASIDGRLVNYKATKQSKSVNCSPQRGLHCYRNSLREDCHDYVVRVFCSCPATTPPIRTGTTPVPTGTPTTTGFCVPGWTEYFNTRHPRNSTDHNDKEYPPDMRKHVKFCSDDMIVDVECATIMYGNLVDYREAGQYDAVACSKHNGLECFSSTLDDDQECHDYMIRFFCECPTTTFPPYTTSTGISTTTAGPCYPGWTGKYNFRHPHDNVGKNDYENTTIIRDHRVLCSDDMITDVLCTTVINDQTVEYREAGQGNAVKCNKKGLVCDSSKLEYDECRDYSIQFYCQCPETTYIPIISTSPRTPGPSTTLPPTVWPRPTTAEPECVHGWTDYFNVSSPNDHPNGDDVESIEKLREKHEFCSKEFIKDIECVASIDGKLVNYKRTKQAKSVNCSPQRGLHCYRNSLREDCHDYAVRIYCGCPERTRKPRTYSEDNVPTTQPGITTTPGPCTPGWTKYFNIDNPKDNPEHNDVEVVENIRKIHSFCSDEMVTRAECVTSINGELVDYTDAGQGDDVKCTPHVGFECFADYLGEECYDYQIRFFCKCPETTTRPPITPSTRAVTTTTEAPTTPFYCEGDWTPFFNLDNPIRNPHGNDEDRISVHRKFKVFCPEDMINNVNCVTYIGGELVDYKEAGQEHAVTCSKTEGVICSSNLLDKDEKCHDYSVRYNCSCPFTPSPGHVVSASGFTTPPPCVPKWTEFFSVDDPDENESGDDVETIEKIKKSFNGSLCDKEMISDVECKVFFIEETEFQDYRDTDQANAVKCSTADGLYCDHSKLTEGERCYNFQVRFFCECLPTRTTPYVGPSTTAALTTEYTGTPTTESPICVHGWTEFFNDNNPDEDKKGNDFETIIKLRQQHSFCSNDMISEVECQTTIDGKRVDYKAAGQNAVTCTTRRGLQCFANAVGGKCKDYSIRFFCSCPITSPTIYTGTPTSPPSTTESTAYTGSPTPGTPCVPGWTKFFNVDNPKENPKHDDAEDINNIRKHHAFCSDEMISNVDCRTRIYGKDVDYKEAGQERATHCTTKRGLHCYAKSTDEKQCADYKIRFYCSCPLTIGTTPARITSTGTASTTHGECVPGWTAFFNVGNPKETPGGNDFERIPDIRKFREFCADEMISDIECQTRNNRGQYVDYREGGQLKGVSCSTRLGLVCDSTIIGEQCKDYIVRFYCNCPTTFPPRTRPFTGSSTPSLPPKPTVPPTGPTPTRPPRCIPGWTQFFNVDNPRKNPTLNDVEQIVDIRKYYEFCSDDMITDVDCKTEINGRDVDYRATGQGRAVNCSPKRGLICFKSSLRTYEQCHNYKVRFYCSCPETTPYTGSPTPPTIYIGSSTLPTEITTYTGPTAGPCVDGWTSFFNVDNPTFNPKHDDNEEILNIRRHFSFCSDEMITDVECKAFVDGELRDYSEAGQTDATNCSPHRGLHCYSNSLYNEDCHDYAIRFFCSCPSTTGTIPPQTTPPPTGTTLTPPPCVPGWTELFNVGNPEKTPGRHDFERIPDIRKYREFCSDEMINDIECQTLIDGKYVDYREGGQIRGVKCSKSVGLICNSSKIHEDCRNYFVRFYCFCPSSTVPTTKSSPVTFTPPKGLTTTEIPPERTTTPPRPTPVIITTPQPRCVPGWTRFFNTDNPKTNVDGGDKEDIRKLRRYYEFCSDEMITDVECVARVNGRSVDYRSAGQAKAVDCSLRKGLRCFKGALPEDEDCHDYSVRFFCLCPSTPAPPSTPSTKYTGSPTIPSKMTPPIVEPTTKVTPPPTPCVPGWTKFFNIDNPRTNTDHDDKENVEAIRKIYSFCSDEMVTKVECVTEIGGKNVDYSEAGQEESVQCSPHRGLRCYKSSLDDDEECHDYKIRFFCECPITTTPVVPTTSAAPCIPGWTKFFNVDHPENNTHGDDNEYITNIRKYHDFCPDEMIGHVDCKALLDGKPVDYKAVGQAKGVQCSPHLGLYCFNNQVKEPCYDYMVRFFCYCPTTTTPYVGPTVTGYTGSPRTTTAPCTSHWTDFFNVDNPKTNPNKDDNEDIIKLREKHDFCEDDMISEAECRTVVDGELVDYRKAGQVEGITCSPRLGLHCYRNLLSEACRDYRIRFFCRCPTPAPEPTTEFTGTTLKPTGPTPKPTTKPPFCEPGWTDFFNLNKPEDNEYGDDTEVTDEIREEHTFCANNMISEVDCRTEVNGQLVDYRSTSQAHAVTCSKHHGVHCYRGQLKEDCRDYSVRFYCLCATAAPTTPLPPTTTATPVTFPSTPACEVGYEFDACAYNCDQTCHHFLRILIESGRCKKDGGSRCIPGCRPKGGCASNKLWLDHGNCVDKKECTCGLTTKDGLVIMPPTAVETFDCERCQCIDNELDCSSIAGCKYTTPTALPLVKTTLTLSPDCWTQWVNDDSPATGGGDFENVIAMHKKYSICVDPQEIECRVAGDKKPASKAGQKVTCDLDSGLTCWNNQNSPTECQDYEIRIRCPCDWTTPPPTTTIVPSPPIGECKDGWTSWFSSHTPDEEGEFESVLNARLNGHLFCGDSMIGGMECRKKGSTSTQITQHKVVCSTGAGLICKNSNQPGYETCDDYEVRFYCDCLTKTTPSTTVTRWPTSVATTPGVGGCNSWSQWINERHPSKAYDVSLDEADKPYDDVENKDLTTLQREQKFCMGGKLAKIECRDSDSDVNYWETTDKNVTCSLKEGLSCQAVDQRTVGCRDYEIRYYCSCAEETTVFVVPSLTTLPIPKCLDHYDVVEELPDRFVRASSSLRPTSDTRHAKLNSDGAWVAGDVNNQQYLEIDLTKAEPVYGVATKGKEDSDEYVKSFYVMYSKDGVAYSYVSEQDNYNERKVFTANVDGNTVVKHWFVAPFVARFVRFQPVSFNKEIAMRVGVYLCQKGSTVPPSITPSLEEVCDGKTYIPLPLDDKQFTFSSVKKPYSEPKIDSPSAWVPSVQDKNQFLEVDLVLTTKVVGIDTKGHNKSPQFVSQYTVSYSPDGTVWNDVKDVDGKKKFFPANSDTQTPVRNFFPKPVKTRFLRIHPTAWEHAIALRVAVLACPPSVTTTPEIIYTSTPSRPSVTTTPHEVCLVYGSWLNLVESPMRDIVIPMKKITSASKLCGNPVDIQCREIITGRDHSDMNQDTTCDLEHGFLCKQGRTHCSTYEVRIACDNSSACVTTVPSIPPVSICDEVPRDKMVNCEHLDCPINFSCDGNKCVPDVDCPCFKDGKSFKPGDRIITSNCKACDCIKGHSRCEDILCTPCPMGQIQKMQPNCECSCFTCDKSKVLCPSDGSCISPDAWCDGVVDCEDDEVSCPLTTESTLTPPPPTRTPPPPTTPPTCSMDDKDTSTCEMNSNYFWTFDGFEYQYDICNNVLVNDMDGKFNITVHKQCEPGRADICHTYVVINLGEREIKFGPGQFQVAIDKTEYTVENLYRISQKYKGEFVVRKSGDGLVLEALKEAFKLEWKPPSIVRVTVSICLRRRLNGLCGLFNNVPQDDLQKPNGRPSSNPGDFGDSWKTSKEECLKPLCDHDQYIGVAKACDELKKSPFDVCHDDANLASYIAICTNFMCECLAKKGDTQKGYKECKCEALKTYADACERNNPSLHETVDGWRAKHGCVPVCPPGQVWEECGHDCVLTCDNYNQRQILCDTNACVPGCSCPHGEVLKNGRCVQPQECTDCECLAMGDPNYVTYDKKHYDFQGNCTYVLSKYDGDDGSTKFEVTEENVPCTDDPSSTCANGVTVKFLNHKIEMNQKGVFIDNVRLDPTESSYEDEDFDITILSDKLSVLHVKENNLIVQYNREVPSAKVQIPSYIYAGKTRGLCGDCDKHPENDFIKPDGKPTSDVYDFGNSWNIPDTSVDKEGKPKLCNDTVKPSPPPPVHICNFTVSVCDVIVDKEIYEEACKNDAGYSKEPEKAVCKSKLQYAQDCCEKDVILKSWIEENECLPKCGVNKSYQCIPGCLKTCDNYKDYDPKKCDHPNIMTCACNPGLVLKDGKCVEPKACEICDDKGHAVGEKWKPDLCEECECKADLKITCQKSICPSPPICKENEVVAKSEAKGVCCVEYKCVPKPPVICEVKPLPDCAEGESLTVSTVDGCPVYKCICQENLCPPAIRPSTDEPGEVYKLVKDGCCSTYKSVCVPEKCKPSRARCYPNQEKVEEQRKCCNETKCVPKTNCYEARDEPNEKGEFYIAHKIGETWKVDKCKKCTCQADTAGSPSTSCETTKCSKPMGIGASNIIFEEIHQPDKCCADYKPFMCTDGIKNYTVGEEWHPNATDYCRFAICTADKVGTISITYRDEICHCSSNNSHRVLTPEPGKCCGECIASACIGEDGNVVPFGDRRPSIIEPCKNVECVQTNTEKGYELVYTNKSCMPISPDCEEENIRVGECCKYCTTAPESTTKKPEWDCERFPIFKSETRFRFKYNHPTHGYCVNEEELSLPLWECGGTCDQESSSIYTEGVGFENGCDCCKPVETKEFMIKLTCRDKETVEIPYHSPIKCKCAPCKPSSDQCKP